jgi:hypothetical protein
LPIFDFSGAVPHAIVTGEALWRHSNPCGEAAFQKVGAYPRAAGKAMSLKCLACDKARSSKNESRHNMANLNDQPMTNPCTCLSNVTMGKYFITPLLKTVIERRFVRA